MHARQGVARSRGVPCGIDEIVRRCVAFQPDVLYFRPIDSSVLFTIVQRVLERIGRPLVIHMMDDWPARLEASNPERFREMDRDLRSLIGRSQRLPSLPASMSAAPPERNGCTWFPLGNGSGP